MKSRSYKSSIIVVLVVSMLLVSGCNEGLKWSDVYGAALGGALIGGIVGYQSHEEGEGAAIGAALCGVGELLDQLDDLNEKDRKDEFLSAAGRWPFYGQG